MPHRKRAFSRYIVAGRQKGTQVKQFCQDVFTRQYWRYFWPALTEEGKSTVRSLVAFGSKLSWGRILAYLGCHAIVVTLCIALPLKFLLEWGNQLAIDDTCQPDGRFELSSSYNVWDLSGVFQITMGFGALSFSNAKLLDAVWDVVVGRGLQGLLALIAYQVTTKSLTMSMEHQAIPIRTFEAITLQDSTLLAFYKQLRNFFSIRSWRHQLRILWIILSTLFVVAFPTLVSAMTGYAPVTEAFLKDRDGQLVPLMSYRSVIYIVHDADRVDLKSPLILTDIPEDPSTRSLLRAGQSDICSFEENMPLEIKDGLLVPSDYNGIDDRCVLIWHVREYVKRYGFLGSTDGPTIFNNSGKIYNISGPALNVEAAAPNYFRYSLSWTHRSERVEALVPERKWEDPRTGEPLFLSYFTAKYTLPDTGVLLDFHEVNAAGSCQQTATYRWGFSFLLLFIVLVLFIVWIVGTYFLWLDTYLHSRLDIIKRDMGLYRAALDITSVLRGDLDKDIDSLTPNTVLYKDIKAKKTAGRISLQHLNGGLPSNTRMMDFLDWGRAGGYSRWTPRLTFAILLMLLITTPMMFLGPSILPGVMSAYTFLIIINFLVLGHGKRRGLRWLPASNSGISHHPLQSFEDHFPSDISPTPTSDTITVMDGSNDEMDISHVEQPSKTATSSTTL